MYYSTICRNHGTGFNIDQARKRSSRTLQANPDVSDDDYMSLAYTFVPNAAAKRSRQVVNPHPTPAEEYPEGMSETLLLDADTGPYRTDRHDPDWVEFANPLNSTDEDDDIQPDPPVACTPEQQCVIKLLKLLDEFGAAPDYAFSSILEWAQDCVAVGFNFYPPSKERGTNIASIYKGLQNAEMMLPSVIPVHLTGRPNPVDVIVYDTIPQILSLVHDRKLMLPENVNIDPLNPFAPYQSPNNVLGEVHNGTAYKWMYNKYITDPTLQLMFPLMGYFDKAHITNGSSRFNLEPGSFTSMFFKETVRCRPDAWRMFGFVHADHK